MSTTSGGAKIEALPHNFHPSLPNIVSPSEPAPADWSSDDPLIIEPTKSWAGLKLRYLWTYRELLYFLALRDLKVRYKQTLLGVTWVILQPLLMTAIFTVFLGRLVAIPSDNVPYSLFAYAGLMLWTFFSGTVSNTGNSLVGNAHLITKVYFPRFILPIATTAARLVDLAVSSAILAVMLLYFRVDIGFRILIAPWLVLLLVLLALAVGMWISAMNVRYRDVGLAVPVLIQLWMFVSPIVYPVSLVPEKWRTLYSLNPLVGITEGFRAALFGLPFNWFAIAIATLVTAIMLAVAAYVFRNGERTFADIV